VAKVLAELITDEETVSGMIYDISKNRRSIPEADESLMAAFTNSCYAMITPFLK
jgi:hypothetical protein